jgi:hypothetical protein
MFFVLQLMVFFGFLHYTVAKCSTILETSPVSIFSMTELAQGGAEMVQKKQSVDYVG